MKILIADDHDLVREALGSLIEKEPDLEVDHAEDFDGAQARIDAAGPFDLVLLDWTMPGMRGLDGLADAIRLNDGKPVALMSGTATRSVAEEALAAGAAGFLPKTMASRSLVSAIRFMAMGEQFAPVQFMTEKEPEQAASPLAAKLTERERQVLEGICAGQSNKEIARDLDLQEVTVKLHVKTACRKLGARNRTQAAMIAKDEGLV
ncbi:response regulator transcription factor [Rhodovulum sp. DZ06]|uniref:response regulator transcription factor n=1 Tax=Rhodovulum sp. DZ06 TaxID=3425126 RepID=UPI003D332FA6